jgi:ribonuclease inhibitor
MDVQQQLASFVTGLRERYSRGDEIIDLAGHNECTLALEILLSNLYEDDVVLTAEEVAAADLLAVELHLAPFDRAVLHAMPLPGETRSRVRILTVAHVDMPQQLHEVLKLALGFPGFYGHNWDAFWDAITGLVEMPQVLELWGWDVLGRKLPSEAYYLLEALLSAVKQFPNFSAEVQLFTEAGQRRDAEVQLSMLRSKIP